MSVAPEYPTPRLDDAYGHYTIEGLPPLHTAAANGEKEALMALLSDPQTDINQQASDGTTALAQAAFYGQARCVKLLIKHGAKNGIKDNHDNCPIHLATVGDHRKSVEVLVDAGARVNRRDGNGLCPLHIAIMKGYEKLVTLILERGARVDKLTREDNLHPLHLAACRGNNIIMRQVLAFHPLLNPLDELGRTPIFLAVENDFPELVSSLVMHGASVSIPSKEGESPLSLAIKRGYEDICHTLCTNGADVSLRYSLTPFPHPIRHYSSDIPSMVPSTVEPTTNQDDNTSEGSNLSDSSVDEVVTQTDRYGHIAKSSLPNNPRHNKLIRIELRRSKKWSDMIKHWSTYSTKRSDKLRSRAAKGIPDCVRGSVWKLLAAGIGTHSPKKNEEGPVSSVQALAALIDANTEKYKRLLLEQSKWTTQIDLDVNRAARNHVMFRERYGKGQRALFSILKAYSSFDSEVGYCQGMSDMTALLLKNMTEEEAFWLLERLMSAPKYGMRQLFLPGFPRLQEAFFVHDALLAHYCPTLAAHLVKENVLAPFYATKWYLLAFLDIFPFEITLRLWDLLLTEGYEIVYSIGVGAMRMWEGEFLGKGFDKIMAFIRNLEVMPIDADKFISFIVKNRISSRRIRKLEEDYNKKSAHKN